MQINGKHYRTIWLKEGAEPTVQVIDQRRLPHALVIEDLNTPEDFVRAIREMHVRGAPLIGATAAYAVYNALYHAPLDKRRLGKYVRDTVDVLLNTRPTAVNLSYALERMMKAIEPAEEISEMVQVALQTAEAITEESIEHCKAIGEHGLDIIQKISKKKKGEPVNILTHCNAGWLACIDHGTATAPIYAAHDAGIPVHVWVD
ncbi:MAG: S-methyl-5-thioribose-1-phosphate isomerase, partial [Phaeodactylibacter sp.]|nr:S-methyl-5-thioribose-1-phosphate isomerase [Phaeodactylibacter sp.]